MAADNFRNLAAYKKAFALAMEIFDLSKKFPAEEKYSLLPTRSDGLRDLFVHASARLTEREDMEPTSSAKVQMLIPRIQKRACGWILPKRAITSRQTCGRGWS